MHADEFHCIIFFNLYTLKGNPVTTYSALLANDTELFNWCDCHRAPAVQPLLAIDGSIGDTDLRTSKVAILGKIIF